MSAYETKDPTDETALQADTDDFVAQIQRIAKGEVEAPNQTVEYLLSQYKDAHADLEGLQRQVLAGQEALIKVRGRMDGLEKDLRFWHGRKAPERAPAEAPIEG